MPFEGIIPWYRDYRARKDVDRFMGQHAATLQSGNPDEIAKIQVDPRNKYQRQAVADALSAWNTAGQGGLIRANTAYTGAQTGLVNQQTRNAGQVFDINAANEGRTKTAESWINDKFGAPNIQAWNALLQDRTAKVGERNAATHEGQLGVQKADQNARFAGNRAAGLAIGMNPMDLTQPMDMGPMLQWQQLQEGDKNRENLRQVNELSQLGHLLSNQQLYMDPQQGPAVLQEMRRRMRIPDATGAQQNSRGEVIQNATQDLAEKNLTFGRNTPPLNMQDVGSNFQGLERPLMGTRQLLHTIGLADDPLQTEVRPQYPQRGERNASLPNDLLFQQPPRVELNQANQSSNAVSPSSQMTPEQQAMLQEMFNAMLYGQPQQR